MLPENYIFLLIYTLNARKTSKRMRGPGTDRSCYPCVMLIVYCNLSRLLEFLNIVEIEWIDWEVIKFINKLP